MYNNLKVTLSRGNCNFPTFHQNTYKKIRMQKCQINVIIIKKFKVTTIKEARKRNSYT
jgi:hypothetical protein